MNELVFLKNRQALTTSLKVADYFEKRHDNVMAAIENSIAQLGGILKNQHTPPFIKTTYTNEQNGQKYPMYLLNRDGFVFVVMGFTGEKAAQLKWAYIQEFNRMEAALAEMKSAEWKELRNSTKRGNKGMCAAIYDIIIPLARAHGSNTPDDKFYMTYQKAVNKAAGVKPKSRDELPLGQLYEVEKMQSLVETSIRGLAARGEDDFKQIFRDTKQTLENYSRLSLIAERFLSA